MVPSPLVSTVYSCRHCCRCCCLVVVFVVTSSSFPLPSSSPSLSLLLLLLPASSRAVVPMATARRAGRGRRPRATQLASSWPRQLSSRRQPLLFVFVVVAVTAHPPCGDGEAGGVGAVAMRDAASLLLALAIVVRAPAFTLALWMPLLFHLTMALVAQAFITVLVLALVLALTQLSACSSTTPCVVLIEQPTPLERRPMTPPTARRSHPRLRAHPPCIPSAPPPLV